MNTGLLTVSGGGSCVLDSLSVTCRLVRILSSIGGSGEGNGDGTLRVTGCAGIK